MMRHLSDEEFADCLMDSGSREARAHLKGCERCWRETEEARAGLSHTRAAVWHWSGARAARVYRAVGWRTGYSLRAASASIAFAVLVFAGVYLTAHLMPDLTHGRQAAATAAREAKAAQVRIRVRERAIAEDDELLLAVNRELDESVAPAMQPLLLSSESAQGAVSGSSGLGSRQDSRQQPVRQEEDR